MRKFIHGKNCLKNSGDCKVGENATLLILILIMQKIQPVAYGVFLKMIF